MPPTSTQAETAAEAATRRHAHSNPGGGVSSQGSKSGGVGGGLANLGIAPRTAAGAAVTEAAAAVTEAAAAAVAAAAAAANNLGIASVGVDERGGKRVVPEGVVERWGKGVVSGADTEAEAAKAAAERRRRLSIVSFMDGAFNSIRSHRQEIAEHVVVGGKDPSPYPPIPGSALASPLAQSHRQEMAEHVVVGGKE
ncbi:hypothetical protein T492DRAFT_843188 [Pavlovales sp. CCMP2436]|nr:hypothetical protein T492DRAFT_843188 [Pavlovales sp. CCMP2436]